MTKANLNRINKYFLYTLLLFFIFAVITLLGCFVAGNTNIFKWGSDGRMTIIVVSVMIWFYAILAKKHLK
tara:strand:- start:7922 stop:8131 length:210 start_codon:yes stop_codon:yes gene_type:complete